MSRRQMDKKNIAMETELRPQKRWVNDKRTVAGKHWNGIVGDEERWKQTGRYGWQRDNRENHDTIVSKSQTVDFLIIPIYYSGQKKSKSLLLPFHFYFSFQSNCWLILEMFHLIIQFQDWNILKISPLTSPSPTTYQNILSDPTQTATVTYLSTHSIEAHNLLPRHSSHS